MCRRLRQNYRHGERKLHRQLLVLVLFGCRANDPAGNHDQNTRRLHSHRLRLHVSGATASNHSTGRMPVVRNQSEAVAPRIWGRRPLWQKVSKISFWGLRFFGGVFLLLGPLKIFGTLADPDYLQFGNALFPFFSNRFIFGLAGALEVGLGMLLIASRQPLIMALSTIWFVIAAVAYKTALALIDYEAPCRCLFGLSQAIQLSKEAESWISTITLMACLSLSSVILLAYVTTTKTGRTLPLAE